MRTRTGFDFSASKILSSMERDVLSVASGNDAERVLGEHGLEVSLGLGPDDAVREEAESDLIPADHPGVLLARERPGGRGVVALGLTEEGLPDAEVLVRDDFLSVHPAD